MNPVIFIMYFSFMVSSEGKPKRVSRRKVIKIKMKIPVLAQKNNLLDKSRYSSECNNTIRYIKYSIKMNILPILNEVERTLRVKDSRCQISSKVMTTKQIMNIFEILCSNLFLKIKMKQNKKIPFSIINSGLNNK